MDVEIKHNTIEDVPQYIIDNTLKIIIELEKLNQQDALGISASVFITLLRNLPITKHKINIINEIIQILTKIESETNFDLNAGEYIKTH